MPKSFLRGHPIICVSDEWIYEDTREPTISTWEDRPCLACKNRQIPEGHDPCLGTLPGVMNACCGHGIATEAYIQFLDGFAIHGISANIILCELKKCLN